MEPAAAIRQAFVDQAGWCDRLGSPFTARLCEIVGAELDRSTAIGRRILDWPGRPDALHDSVPLRLAGALHALVRRGADARLAALYPPNLLPDARDLWGAVRSALGEHETDLQRWLDFAPQTNEVARSAVLMSGLAVAAAESGLPLSLFELGASAGLNLLMDRFDIRLGGVRHGHRGSGVRIEPRWDGPDPPGAEVRIAARRGVDLNPLDAGDPHDRERLAAYVWADQTERLRRVEAALALAAEAPPSVDRGDAAEWLERVLPHRPEPPAMRVVLHSIAFQYFPPDTQGRIAASMEREGGRATASAPLAWLRYEVDAAEGGATLRLRLWPDGPDRLLARADPHGRAVTWVG